MSEFTIRPIVPDDVAFVVNAWLEGYWPDCPCSLVMPKSAWWPRWHRVIENILADERTRTVVACLPDDQTQLLGFACARPPSVLHWCYVKQAFRHNGIAAGMLAELEGLSCVSHASAATARAFRRNELGDFIYDPRLIKEYQP